MPWIKEEKLYPVVVLLLIFIMAVRMPMDSDMWWHLKAGEETLTTGQVYRIDTFSSTRSGQHWINHSWLSQVLMAALLRIGNFPALSIWVALCAVISMGLVYMQMEGHPLLRSAILILAALVSSVVWSPRPQILSLVLLALLCWITNNFRQNKKWTNLVVIPFLFTLWGNLHGGYVLGLIYLGAFIAGEFLDKILFQNTDEGLSWKEIGLVALAAGAGIIFVLVNPFGWEMWKIPFSTIGVETLQNLINEWSSPDFHQAFQQPFLWMLLGLLAALSLSKESLRGYRLVPVVVFAWAALVARRNFGPFAIVCGPALANQLNLVLKDWMQKARGHIPEFETFMQSADTNKRTFNITARNLINVTLIGLLIFAGVMKTIQVNGSELVSQTERELFPVGAVEWIKDRDQPSKIFNDYNWGGYLIYNLPEMPVFVDGRTDLYGDEILNDYLDLIFCKEKWEEALVKYEIGMLVIRSDSCLIDLAVSEGWKILYIDNNSTVLGN